MDPISAVGPVDEHFEKEGCLQACFSKWGIKTPQKKQLVIATFPAVGSATPFTLP